jgi:signal transduction histidine kinase
MAINVYTAMLIAGLANTSLSREARIALAAVISLTLPLLLTLMSRRSLLMRLQDLRDAFERVRRDDLSAHLPNLAGDELDDVGASFNRMVQGLRERAALQDELQASRGRIVAAADASRRAVERDLHDGAQQHLVLLKLKLGLLERRVAGDSGAATMVADVKGELDRALAELRDLAHGIYPPALTNDGLAHALDEAAARAGVPTSVECADRRYPAELEAAIYFCCVEALQNAAKHAGDGATAHVTVEERDGQLWFEVADDGRGFDPAMTNGSAGLQNMADRVGALGGRLALTSDPAGGTRVAGEVPVPAQS